ncbi:hypothetical protein BDQ12DRAFT_688542 [Crucibulum laeve]|uniref:FAD-binding PCMH-type domain-containing protein n=1 Tax=Crucibulum laeve TaxID=68775 RepID=A0A5C3LQN1_9AGAR|nr:hypothetical protein BDQ12DRAFT_688542 [Crucibulum laeve]
MRFRSTCILAATVFHTYFDGILAINSTALQTCTQLQTTLGSDIVQFPNGPEYLNSSANAYSFFNAEILATCIVLPRQASHVQIAMAAIFKNKVHYAVRAGGHSGMTGWNAVQDGILFFFSHMKSISYDDKKDTITLQPGIRWGEAVQQLQPFGVTPMGGRLPDVGTGLLLGGGYSYLSRQHGFACDAFIELDVVLVNGELVTATATNEHADLFRALKGGANRFGIVTRYEVQAIHASSLNADWFGGLVLYPNSSVEAILAATHKFTTTVTDPNATFDMVFVNTVNGSDVVGTHGLTLLYHGSALPPGIFDDFLAIPAINNQLGPITYLTALNLSGPGNDRGSGAKMGAGAVSGGVEEYTNAYRAWNDFTTDPAVKPTLAWSILAFTPISKFQISVGRARGSNSFDPPLVNYAAIDFQANAIPGLREWSPQVEAARQTVFKRMPPSPGLPLYMNESDQKQKVFATYGRFEELKRTYAKYDPTRFNVRFTDGPPGL